MIAKEKKTSKTPVIYKDVRIPKAQNMNVCTN
jgi:hypothetical protein